MLKPNLGKIYSYMKMCEEIEVSNKQRGHLIKLTTNIISFSKTDIEVFIMSVLKYVLNDVVTVRE